MHTVKQFSVISGFILLTLSASAFSQKIPSFSAYKVRIEKFGKVTVNLKSHKNARMFRTRLRDAAAKEDVNFAGHYILTVWGCGTNCSQWAIIDARNGNVFFPKEFEGVGSGFCELPRKAIPADAPPEAGEGGEGPVFHKTNSRMILLIGFPGGGLDNNRAKCGNYFYEWTGTRLRRIKFVAGNRTATP
jgi:hypothetical protein